MALVDPSTLRIAAVTHGKGSDNEHLADECPGGDAWPCVRVMVPKSDFNIHEHAANLAAQR